MDAMPVTRLGSEKPRFPAVAPIRGAAAVLKLVGVSEKDQFEPRAKFRSPMGDSSRALMLKR